MEMDLSASAADCKDYIHSDKSLQFKRERRKVCMCELFAYLITLKSDRRILSLEAKRCDR